MSNPNPQIRKIIYIVSGLGSLIVGYAQVKGYIGTDEVALWSGITALVNGLSAINVSNK